jgi:hypothetical protein
VSRAKQGKASSLFFFFFFSGRGGEEEEEGLGSVWDFRRGDGKGKRWKGNKKKKNIIGLLAEKKSWSGKYENEFGSIAFNSLLVCFFFLFSRPPVYAPTCGDGARKSWFRRGYKLDFIVPFLLFFYAFVHAFEIAITSSITSFCGSGRWQSRRIHAANEMQKKFSSGKRMGFSFSEEKRKPCLWFDSPFVPYSRCWFPGVKTVGIRISHRPLSCYQGRRPSFYFSFFSSIVGECLPFAFPCLAYTLATALSLLSFSRPVQLSQRDLLPHSYHIGFIPSY